MSHSIKRGVKLCPNHSGPQREQKDTRRAWPSWLGTAVCDGKGWYKPVDGDERSMEKRYQDFKDKLNVIKAWKERQRDKALARAEEKRIRARKNRKRKGSK